MTQVSKINGISIINTSVSAFTYDGVNQFTIDQTDGVSFNAQILTLSATSISATTFYGDGSNLTGIAGGNNTYTTGMTFNTNTLTATNSTGGTYTAIISLGSHTGDTNNPHSTTLSNLTSSAHTHTLNEITDFDAYSGNVQTLLDAKVEGSLFDTHTGDTNNPHSVTAAQLGAATEAGFDAHTGDTTIHYTKGSINLSELGTTAHTHTLNEITDFDAYSAATDTKIDTKSSTDSYITGTTFNDTIITYNRNNGLSALTTDLTGLNVEYNFLKDSAGTLNVGEVVFLKSWNDTFDIVSVEQADSSTVGAMPALGIVTTSGSSTVQGVILSLGNHEGFDTSAWGLRDPLYVSTTPGALTNVRPTGSTSVQTIGRVLKVDASLGVIAVFGAGRSNDLPNITANKIWIGDTDGTPTEKTLASSGATVTIAIDGSTINFESSGAGEINTASNVGVGVGIFSGKTGDDLTFKSLTSTGGTVTITSTGATINLESAIGGGVATDTIWDATGDLAVGTGANTAARLGIGSTNQVLTVVGGTAAWAAAAGGSSRIASSAATTDATPTELEKIDTLTAESTHVIEVFITSKSDDDVQWGVWKRTLVVSLIGGVVTIRHENADVDKTSAGLSSQSIDFTVNSTDIDIDVTGIAATNIQWNSTYEIITKSTN